MTYRITDKRYIKRLGLMNQFQGIPDHMLMRLAHRRTKLVIADRWSAIDLLIKYPVPIPVPVRISEKAPRGTD